MNRPTIDEWAIGLAMVTAQRTTCLKRQVGAVLLSIRDHVLATGYNGVAPKMPHCNLVTGFNFIYANGIDKTKQLTGQATGQVDVFGHACPNALAPIGSNLGGCQALHAEWNALLQCQDIHAIGTCYVTTAPCETCTKMLLGTSCQRIVFLESHDAMGQYLWLKAGRVWEQLNISPFIRSHTGSYIGLLPRPSGM